MNLFVSEFVVALHGDIDKLTDDDRQQLAIAAGTPEAQLSRRPWLFFDGVRAGAILEIGPDWFAEKAAE